MLSFSKFLALTLLCSVLIFSSTIKAKNAPHSVFKELDNLHQCTKVFEYKIFLAGVEIGSQSRIVYWKNNKGNISATTTSKGKVSVFGIGSNYQQNASFLWSEQQRQFLTTKFHQVSTGINARNMEATLSSDARSAEVIVGSKKRTEVSKSNPLYDIDTMGEQIRLNLINNIKSFEIYRLSSKKIKKYVFEVIGDEKLNLKNWGETNTIRVNEVGKFDKMVLWFSPEHDFQMVKANIDAFISPVVLLTAFNKQCN